MEEETTPDVEGESDLMESITYSEEYGIAFPLPAHEDESLCRDEYLKKLFEEYEQDEVVAARRTFASESMSRHRRTGTPTGIGNAEAMAIIRMLRKNRKTVEIQPTEFKMTLTAAEKQIIFKNFLVQFKKDAVEYLSVKLKKSLEVFVNIWPGELTQIPYNLFHWSVEHFEARCRVNQLYLDVLTIERSEKDLNCAKFCTDVNEIIRLLDAIRNDVRLDMDLCQGSIALMKDSNYDQNAKWILDLEKNRDIRSKLALEVFAQHDTKDKQFRESLQISESKVNDAYLPIELRYRINWVRSNGEQHLIWLQKKEKVLQDELDEINNQMKGDKLAHEFRDSVYQYEVDKYRVSIAKWEEQLEVDMESIELKCSVTRNLYSKAKDDLKFCMDQVEMFKQKVAQVLELEEEEEHVKRSQGYRRSTKISFDSLKKPKNKKKNNKKK